MKSKIAAVFTALMVMLMFVGVAYAIWTKQLTISGTVHTGYVDAKFTAAAVNDPDGTLDPKSAGTWTYPLAWSGDIWDKDVGYATVSSVSPYDTLTVTVYNAYPSYAPGVGFTIDNIGTIPVKIKSIKLTMVSESGDQFPVDVDLVKSTWYYWVRGVGITTTAPSDWNWIFAIHISEISVGDQIEVGEYKLGDLTIHIGEQAIQSATYDFKIKVEVANWNEV